MTACNNKERRQSTRVQQRGEELNIETGDIVKVMCGMNDGVCALIYSTTKLFTSPINFKGKLW